LPDELKGASRAIDREIPSKRRMSADRVFLHHDEIRALEVAHQRMAVIAAMYSSA
jgi:hypothetical protein